MGDDTAAGYLAPSAYSNEIIKALTEISPVRQVARVTPIAGRSLVIPKRTGQFCAGQMIGQAAAVARYMSELSLPAGHLWRQIGLGPGNIGIEVLEAELQLVVVEALRPASKLVALQCLDDLPQPVDLGMRPYPLAVERRCQLADHAMQRGDVVRQGGEVYVHELILGPTAHPAESYAGRESISRSVTPRQPASIDARESASRSRRAEPRADRR